jgi:hypothetical protein
MTDKEMCALAASALLLHEAAAPTASHHQRLAWECDMRFFLHQLGATRREAGICNELIYQHRYKGHSIADALVAARAELKKPLW